LHLSTRIIQNKENIGFAGACNQGIKIAGGKYLFIVNPDIILLNNGLVHFYEFMEENENDSVWCLGAQLYNKNNKPVKSAGSFPTIFDAITEQIGLKGLFLKVFGENYLNEHIEFRLPTIVEFIIGCNMFIRKQALRKIGLFNTEFFLNYEETELAWRAKNYGLKSMVLPEVKILHYSGTSFENIRAYFNYLWLGQLLFFKFTKSKPIFLVIKTIHLLGAIMRFIFKLDVTYLSYARQIIIT
jgi:hypothetical protein